MKKIHKIIFVLLLVSVSAGPLFQIDFFPQPLKLYPPDIVVLLLNLLLLPSRREWLRLYRERPEFKAFGLFILVALASWLFSPIRLSQTDKIISLLYLVRFMAYFQIYPLVLIVLEKQYLDRQFLLKIISLFGIFLVIAGWLQYFLYPDLRNLYYLGWDPHYRRIFSTVLDPNYFGLILVVLFLFRLSNPSLKQEIIYKITFLFTLAFTYSRSSYVSFASGALYWAFRSGKFLKYFLAGTVLILTLFLLPRPGGAGVELERLFSIRERLSNWQTAVTIVKNKPFLGVGFNTLRFNFRNSQYLREDWLTSHSAAGIDNSFLFVAASSGLLGLAVYLVFLTALFLRLDATGKSLMIAAAVHSLFLNSLFFTYFLVWFYLLSGLQQKFKESTPA